MKLQTLLFLVAIDGVLHFCTWEATRQKWIMFYDTHGKQIPDPLSANELLHVETMGHCNGNAEILNLIRSWRAEWRHRWLEKDARTATRSTNIDAPVLTR